MAAWSSGRSASNCDELHGGGAERAQLGGEHAQLAGPAGGEHDGAAPAPHQRAGDGLAELARGAEHAATDWTSPSAVLHRSQPQAGAGRGRTAARRRDRAGRAPPAIRRAGGTSPARGRGRGGRPWRGRCGRRRRPRAGRGRRARGPAPAAAGTSTANVHPGIGNDSGPALPAPKRLSTVRCEPPAAAARARSRSDGARRRRARRTATARDRAGRRAGSNRRRVQRVEERRERLQLAVRRAGAGGSGAR